MTSLASRHLPSSLATIAHRIQAQGRITMNTSLPPLLPIRSQAQDRTIRSQAQDRTIRSQSPRHRTIPRTGQASRRTPCLARLR